MLITFVVFANMPPLLFNILSSFLHTLYWRHYSLFTVINLVQLPEWDIVRCLDHSVAILISMDFHISLFVQLCSVLQKYGIIATK